MSITFLVQKQEIMKLKPIQYKIVFNRKNKLNKNGVAPITIRCYQSKIQKHISTGVSIEPKFWDEKRQQIKRSHPNAFVLNNRIREQLRTIVAYEMEMIGRLGSFPVTRIVEYDSYNTHRKSFSDFFAEQLEAGHITNGSVRTRRVTLRKLLKFNKNRKVYFNDLTFQFIKRFGNWLHKQGLSTNTVHKCHKHLKTYINLAIKYDLFEVDKNPYKKFKAPTDSVDRIFLMPDELERIENLSFEIVDSASEAIRDMFLFSCYTGLRFSDVRRVAKKNIEVTKEGLILNFKAKKTNKHALFPLYVMFKTGNGQPSKPEAIVYKYLKKRQYLYNQTDEFDEIPFFDYSNQYTNRVLKEIAKRAKVTKSITTHVARRTFGTVAASKVPIPILQQLLQHSNIKETMLYIDNNPLLLIEALKKADW